MLTMIWIYWVLNTFMGLIILLNFLIAMISQSYEEVLSTYSQTLYSDRASLNQECALLKNKKRPIDCIIISITKDEDGGEQQFSVLNLMKNLDRKLNETTDCLQEDSKILKEKVEKDLYTTKSHLTKLLNETQTKVVRDIDTTKTDLTSQINEKIENTQKKM